ncbi:LysR substrate-binding domain-containing protein [Herbaspirillum lusitanum]|uniref:LysR substrate-binding domain-containing protein n=1 Tax=Herbaspirillum lusitanum TaxID=213312 RepID=A0ABW9AFL3_9BURK
MSAINHFNLRNFDLNLLIAFDALMRDRSVTKAAARLKVQQPAMSHSLATLRLLLEDELFVRVGNQMAPTAKAEMLTQHVSQILQYTQQLLSVSDTFDPLRSERTFNVGFFCEELLVLPQLGKALATCAPGVKLLARRVLTADVAAALDNGSLDIAIGCTPPPASRFRSEDLFDQELACCHNPNLLALDGDLDLDTWLSARHAFVSEHDAAEGCLGSFLIGAGYPINVVLGTPDYLSLLAAVADAPLLATLPAQIAYRYASRFGLVTRPAPFQVPLAPVQIIWSAGSDADQGLAWMRYQIKVACASSSAVTATADIL